MEKNIFVDKLLALAHKHQIPLESKHCETLYSYHQLLLKYNQLMNLTAITDETEIIHRHYFDSLTLLIFKKAFQNSHSRLIDIGTGPGFPGIPLAIVLNHISFILVDSQKKKTDFLELVVDKLNLKNVSILRGRAESLAHHHSLRESYNIATARAVAPLSVLLEYLLPFLTIDGYALCMKGDKVQEELKDAGTAAELLGGNILPSFPLPSYSAHSSFLVISQKLYPSPSEYPRRTGIPSKRPLK